MVGLIWIEKVPYMDLHMRERFAGLEGPCACRNLAGRGNSSQSQFPIRTMLFPTTKEPFSTRCGLPFRVAYRIVAIIFTAGWAFEGRKRIWSKKRLRQIKRGLDPPIRQQPATHLVFASGSHCAGSKRRPWTRHDLRITIIAGRMGKRGHPLLRLTFTGMPLR